MKLQTCGSNRSCLKPRSVSSLCGHHGIAREAPLFQSEIGGNACSIYYYCPWLMGGHRFLRGLTVDGKRPILLLSPVHSQVFWSSLGGKGGE